MGKGAELSLGYLTILIGVDQVEEALHLYDWKLEDLGPFISEVLEVLCIDEALMVAIDDIKGCDGDSVSYSEEFIDFRLDRTEVGNLWALLNWVEVSCLILCACFLKVRVKVFQVVLSD